MGCEVLSVGVLSVQIRLMHSQGGDAAEFFYEWNSSRWGLDLIRPWVFTKWSLLICSKINTPLGPGSCRSCWQFGSRESRKDSTPFSSIAGEPILLMPINTVFPGFPGLVPEYIHTLIFRFPTCFIWSHQPVDSKGEASWASLCFSDLNFPGYNILCACFAPVLLGAPRVHGRCLPQDIVTMFAQIFSSNAAAVVWPPQGGSYLSSLWPVGKPGTIFEHQCTV